MISLPNSRIGQGIMRKEQMNRWLNREQRRGPVALVLRGKPTKGISIEAGRIDQVAGELIKK